jgi:hypothetical protein
MAGIVGQYNVVPRIRTVRSIKIISPVGGDNPVDLGFVELPNVRGQVSFTIIASDDPSGVSASFNVTGGFGEWPDDPTHDWYVDTNTIVNCIVTSPVKNRIVVTTELSAIGGTDRQYTIIFNPGNPFSPQIRQTSVAIIGNNTLTVEMVKYLVMSGF